MYRPEFRLAVIVPRGSDLVPVKMTMEDAETALAPDTEMQFCCTGDRCSALRPAREMWNLHFKLRDDGALILYCGRCARSAREKGFTNGKDLFRFGVTVERVLAAYKDDLTAWEADKADQRAKHKAWIEAEKQRRAMQRLERRFGINPERLKLIRGSTTEDKPTSRKERKSRGFDWVAAERERKAREQAAQADQQPEGTDDASAQA